ncbi:PKD domain-containing protein [Haladaptatus sp. W1]|uniref:PKD domain-containing protein n=1 Tax=Haladaptatus sp. W1 TaxID=1897478 RepID=UPI00373FC96F
MHRSFARSCAEHSLEPGDWVTLDASCSSDPDGRGLHYEWTGDDKFEGDNFCIGAEVPDSGEKEVRVTVTDSDGDTDTASVVLTAS